MLSSAEFVEASIAHQLGDLSQNKLVLKPDALELALAASSKMAVAWNHAKAAPYRVNGWEKAAKKKTPWDIANPAVKNGNKVTPAVEQILSAGADFDLVVDMQDHRTRNLLTPQNEAVPVLAFNRPIEKNTGHILWPLPGYHDVDGPNFLGDLNPNRIPWAAKKDMVVWRGGPANRGVFPKGRGSIRMLPLLRRFKSGKMTQEEVEAVLLSMPRYRFVKRWCDDPRFDVGFTTSNAIVLAEEPFLDVFERPSMTREKCQTYKYIAVLPGNDVGSSFYWTMNSGSLGLVVDCDFETFATHHFKPWEHYIPVRRDYKNMERILRWCQSNPEDCQAIAKNAQEKCKYLADQDLRYQTNKGVIAKIRQELTQNRST